jgi:hypothetical protein
MFCERFQTAITLVSRNTVTSTILGTKLEMPGLEPVPLKSGGTGYIVKPRGIFNPDYFAETELEEKPASW